MGFRFQKLQIPDVLLVQASTARDDRGFFREVYKQSEFSANGMPQRFIQDNCAHSTGHILRGLHYQKNPHAQGKYIFVLDGKIFDVAVDIRKGSPTYAKWVGEELSADNGRALYVPPGFAHGYAVLSESASVAYKVTAEYAPDADRGILWNDPEVGVEWPLADPILSPKDARLPVLKLADNNFTFEDTR